VAGHLGGVRVLQDDAAGLVPERAQLLGAHRFRR
jgi:hypothetical protein